MPPYSLPRATAAVQIQRIALPHRLAPAADHRQIHRIGCGTLRVPPLRRAAHAARQPPGHRRAMSPGPAHAAGPSPICATMSRSTSVAPPPKVLIWQRRYSASRLPCRMAPGEPCRRSPARTGHLQQQTQHADVDLGAEHLAGARERGARLALRDLPGHAVAEHRVGLQQRVGSPRARSAPRADRRRSPAARARGLRPGERGIKTALRPIGERGQPHALVVELLGDELPAPVQLPDQHA